MEKSGRSPEGFMVDLFLFEKRHVRDERRLGGAVSAVTTFSFLLFFWMGSGISFDLSFVLVNFPSRELRKILQTMRTPAKINDTRSQNPQIRSFLSAVQELK